MSNTYSCIDSGKLFCRTGALLVYRSMYVHARMCVEYICGWVDVWKYTYLWYIYLY